MKGWNIALLDQSSSGVDADLTEIAKALQRQLDRDFSHVWGVTGRLRAYESADKVPDSAWPITIVDDVEGAGGVHLDDNGRPYAQVANGPKLTIALSHELLEMLADPWGNRFVVGPVAEPADVPHQVFYLVEVCDPCETASYEIDDITLSDFVFPWFYRTPAPGQVDHLAELDGPLVVPPGCFVCWIDPLDACWHQRLPDGSVVTADYIDEFSPRAARDAAFAGVMTPRHVTVAG